MVQSMFSPYTYNKDYSLIWTEYLNLGSVEGFQHSANLGLKKGNDGEKGKTEGFKAFKQCRRDERGMRDLIRASKE